MLCTGFVWILAFSFAVFQLLPEAAEIGESPASLKGALLVPSSLLICVAFLFAVGISMCVWELQFLLGLQILEGNGRKSQQILSCDLCQVALVTVLSRSQRGKNFSDASRSEISIQKVNIAENYETSGDSKAGVAPNLKHTPKRGKNSCEDTAHGSPTSLISVSWQHRIGKLRWSHDGFLEMNLAPAIQIVVGYMSNPLFHCHLAIQSQEG